MKIRHLRFLSKSDIFQPKPGAIRSRVKKLELEEMFLLLLLLRTNAAEGVDGYTQKDGYVF